MPQTANDLVLRPARRDDISFIFDSWLRSWRKSPWAGIVPNNVYYPLTRSVIEQLVARGAEFKVAALESNPDHILGWICYELLPARTPDGPEAVIHYLYVKDPYLPLGIDDQLVAAVPGVKPGFYTFRYRQVVEALDRAKGPEGQHWKHAPEIARRK